MGSRCRRVQYCQYIIIGEGDDEVVFLKHLKSVYIEYPERLVIKNGYGGKPLAIVKRLRALPQLSAYQGRLAIFDEDVSESKIQDAIKECIKDPKIEYLLSKKRFEIEIFKVLDYSEQDIRRFSTDDSASAKEEFARKFKSSNVSQEEIYKKLLPKEFLEKARKSSKWLNRIISFMEKCDKNGR